MFWAHEVPVSRFGFWVGFGGFWAGSGRAGWVLERVLVGSGWVLELKNTTLKSLKFIVKNSILGSGGCKLE